ncbi:MAG TPA: diadenylate cyclase CdaA [Myxococcota bacterium]|nr:diadenylate cyclase CdaA [Myxococcota bacterium]HQK50419.1 diadenylate cyclase CdaA [Myxococcota bacterium]
MSTFFRTLSDLSFLELLAAAVDILIVYYLIYRTMLLLRGTRAIQMLVGIVFALALFLLSQENLLNLTTVNWILEKFVSSFILVLIVLFAPDIRRALSEVGKNPLFVGIARHGTPSLYDEVIQAVTRLSSKRIGALIVLAREADLTSYTEEAIPLDARVTHEALFSIFIPSHENPLHDGAVIISEGRISHAACFLPLTENPSLDKSLGTRHRAGIGLTESTDAVVIIVSEETGIISLAEHGELKRNLDGNLLRSELLRLFGPKARKERDG